MTIQQAKDKAAQENGYKDWAHAIYLMNESGISALTDAALVIVSVDSHAVGFEAGYEACGRHFSFGDFV